MKLLTFSLDGCEMPGVLSADGTRVYSLDSLGFSYPDMNSLVEQADSGILTAISDAAAKKDAAADDSSSAGSFPLSRVSLCPPIPTPRQDIICLGINYAAHAEESARYKKEAFERNRKYAVYFSKRVNRAVADGEPIDGHFDMVERLDYEAELAVILNRDAFRVPEDKVYDYILGYTIMNDISARQIQTLHKQWYFGKSLDGFTPLGPWIVTKDEFAYPPELKISSHVNGELRQNSTTGLLIFSISQVVAELSQGMTLKAGTIISMGTPAGVGMGFDPPRFLRSGDVVSCEIEGIGSLTNPIA